VADHYDVLTDAEKAKIAVDGNGCWLWLGYVMPTGYGCAPLGMAKRWGGSRYTHRIFYTRFVGEVPEGLEIDHLCRVKRCCNPDHLEAVTRSVNILRGPQPELVRKRHAMARALRTHCPHGHSLRADNVGLQRRDGRVVSTYCQICHRANAARFRAKRRGGDAQYV
jgi:hypothetical protein